MARNALVTIENATLLALSSNSDALKEFPFLANLTKAKGKSCGCPRDRNRKVDSFEQARINIASMDATKKRRLKAYLNADKARVRYRSGSGKVIVLTF